MAATFSSTEPFSGPIQRDEAPPIVVEIEYRDGAFWAKGVDKLGGLETQRWGGRTPQEAVTRLLAQPREWI
jgi:hypothetical protein